jgi:AcrR family transcriptional regulator
LIAVARLRIDSTLTPTGLRLQRFLHTESYRFPDLVNAAYSRITGPTIEFIVELLQRHNAEGTTDVADPVRAAAALMNMVVGVPVRMVLLGLETTDAEIEHRIQFSVDLFLNGVCRR